MAISISKTAAAIWLLLGTLAFAQPTPEQKCEAGMIDKAGRYAACIAKAQAKASIGAADYERAELACARAMSDAWERIELEAADAGATCPSINSQNEIQNFLDACADSLWETAGGEALQLDVETCNDGMYWLGKGATIGSTFANGPVSVDANVLFGTGIDVPYKVLVTGLGVVGVVAGPNFRLALYRRGTDGVGELLVETPSTPLPAGSLTVDVPVIALEPGRYLLATVFDAPASLGINYSNYTTRVRGDMNFADPFPDPADALLYNGGDQPSLFLQLF